MLNKRHINYFLTMETHPAKKIKVINSEKEFTKINSSNCNAKAIEPTSTSDSSAFSKIVSTIGFIDKTLLIKELFETTCKVLITAPRRFGKSTNLDMVKKFLEIDVDYSGKLMDTSTTANYKLFAENNLKILQHEQFCKQHLGKHPVMIIDYKPLSEVNNFETMISEYKLILRKTYEQHCYLTEVSQLWTGNLKFEKFKSYIDPDKNINLDVFDLKCGFIFLAEVLHKYFGKPVFLLIDEYDCYFNSFMFKDVPDMSRIINFVQSTTADLLKSSNHIDHALIMGVLRLSSEGLSLNFSQCLNSINHCKFQHKHPFCTYFGLTNREMCNLLKKISKNEKDQEKYIKTIDKYYNGYEIINKKIKIYSLWSVMDFFENNMKVRRKSCRDDYIFRIKSVFRVHQIADKVLQLLLGKFVEVDISIQFSKTNVLLLSDLMKSVEHKSVADNIFFIFLYYMGYLSVAKVKQEHLVALKTPNQEVSFQFAKLLKESYESNYNFNPKHVEHFQFVANSFRQSQMNDEKLTIFCKAISDLFLESCWQPNIKMSITSILFVLLACNFSIIKSKDLEETSNILYDFMAVNDHDIALFVHAKLEEDESKDTLCNIATKAYKTVIGARYDSVISKVKRKLRGKVYLGVSCSLDKKFAFAYSIVSKEGNSTQIPIIIS